MTYYLSIFSYVFMTSFSILLTRLLEKEKNKNKKIMWFILIILSLSFLPALRSSQVGIDTKNYLNAIYYMLTRNYVWYKSEPGLFLLSRIVVLFTHNPHSVIIVSTLFINTLVLLGIYKFREYVSLPFSVLVYIAVFYLETFNIMRQWLAISIVFASYHYIKENDYFNFFVMVIIATIFHNTAIASLLIVLINKISSIINKSNWSNIKLWFKNKFIKVVIMATFLLSLFFSFFYFDTSRFDYIFSSLNSGGNYGLLGWVRLLMGFVLAVLIKNEDTWNDINYKFFIMPYLVLLLSEVWFYKSRFTLRIFLYLSSFQILSVGFLVKELKKHKVYIIFLVPYFVLNTALFFNYLLRGKGILPYSFFWQ